ncbi:MAG: twin-arginine translocase TatA/TatE family subunit [Planctomycetaceae bacterium]|nr:twin-arginine translocase TatA/TatE family subunit [Planctomycetaceae bacterium]
MIYSMIFGFGGFSGPLAYIVLAAVAFLLFGNRLPSVMRSLGRSVVEFKKGVAGIEDDLDEAVRTADEKATSKSAEKTEV